MSKIGEIGCVKAGFKCTDSGVGANRFVQLDTSECDATATVVEQGGAGTKVFGITYETTAAANRIVGVNLEGICLLDVDGADTAITAGDYLKSDASGKGVKAAADKDEVGAVALEDASAATTIRVQIRKFTLSV